MKMKFAALSASICLMLVSPAHAVLYSVTDLGTLGGTASEFEGFDGSRGGAINNSGTVVGISETAGNAALHPFVWTSGTGMVDLTTVTGQNTLRTAEGVNDSGTIVGQVIVGGHQHAYSYTTAGVFTDLGMVPGGTTAAASSINASGQITGNATVGVATHTFLYSGGTMTDIGPVGGLDNQGIAINSSGTIAGYTEDGPEQAFTYSGTATDYGQGELFGINNAGTSVGDNGLSSNAPIIISSTGVITTLGTFGGTSASAYGINSAGDVVGFSYTTGNASEDAFVYIGGVMYDLNSVLDGSGAGWSLTDAVGINDSGQIVGDGMIGGQFHIFLLNPVPEPGSIAMLVGGLGLLGAVARRRR